MKRFVIAACLAYSLVAHAAHYGTSVDYVLHGFSADGKYVFFERTTSGMQGTEKFLAVYDATRAKQATSQPIFRDCGMMDSPDEQGGPQKCLTGTAIAEKVGNKTVAKLHAKYGAPTKANVLASSTSTDLDTAIADAKKSGFVQEWTGTDVTVKTTSKLVGKLPDPMQDYGKPAPYQVELVVTYKGATRTLKRSIYAVTIDDSFNGNIQHWDALYVEDLAVASDGRALAFIFANKPHVVKLPFAAKP